MNYKNLQQNELQMILEPQILKIFFQLFHHSPCVFLFGAVELNTELNKKTILAGNLRINELKC